MPFIEFQQRLYPLRKGENLLGRDGRANIRLAELPPDCFVGISVEGPGASAWGAGNGVEVNGHPLGEEPIPLFHGDELRLCGTKLVFVDDDAELPVPAEEFGSAEGPEIRMVAVLRRLDNNQIYMIDRAGFRIGREKRCDLIIPDRSVSRLHAEITLDGDSYRLRDLGRTGVRVNGRKIGESHTLKVGDEIEIGKYRFGFARRPAAAEEILRSHEVTPIRSTVPDAPTMIARRGRKSSALTWVLLAAIAAFAALILLG